MDVILDTLIGSTSLLTICLTVLATLAITLIFKTSYTTNFAQGVISAFGAYVVAQMMYDAGLSVWACLPVGVIVGMALGVFIDIGIIRNGRNVNAVGKQIITMGLVSVIVGLIPIIFAVDGLESRPAMPLVPIKEMFDFGGGFKISYNSLIALAITVAIVTLVFVLLYKSKWGLGVRATASNEYVAGMMGINTRAITAISWSIAGGIGAISAVMLAWKANSLSSTFMTTVQVNAFLACILGGFGTFYGPVIAAVILCLLTSVVGMFGWDIGFFASYKEAIVYIVALVIVLIKPQGLFGKKTVKKV